MNATALQNVSATGWLGGGGVLERWSVCRADNLTTFLCRFSRILEALTSWEALGL